MSIRHYWKKSIDRICETCWKIFKVFPYKVREWHWRFCCKKCYNIYLSTHPHKWTFRKWHITKRDYTKYIISNETRKKQSESHKWEKSSRWLWWITEKPYSVDWTDTLRRSIRERDRYTCKLCWEQQWDRLHAVHHIDYDKQNCNPDNLMTLCVSCHARTNIDRENWIKYFNNLQK